VEQERNGFPRPTSALLTRWFDGQNIAAELQKLNRTDLLDEKIADIRQHIDAVVLIASPANGSYHASTFFGFSVSLFIPGAGRAVWRD
jgi:hypothetical protein